MPQIKQLDPHIADLIAAGEVVERFPNGSYGPAGDPLLLLNLGEVNSPKFKVFSSKKRLYAEVSACGTLRHKGGWYHASNSAA